MELKELFCLRSLLAAGLFCPFHLFGILLSVENVHNLDFILLPIYPVYYFVRLMDQVSKFVAYAF